MFTAMHKARTLRQNATEAERRLWSALRNRRLRDYRFRRQYPIGRFIVDLACTRHQLVVEVNIDGVLDAIVRTLEEK